MELGVALAPPETAEVRAHLQALIDAHVGALLPGFAVAPRLRKLRPGPKGGLKNPHPLWRRDALIDAKQLAWDFDVLRKRIKATAHDLDQRRDETNVDAAQRIERAIRDILDEWGPGWSSLREERLLDPSWKADPRKAPWDQIPPATSTQWNIDASRVVEALLAKPGPALKKKEGAPTYVASALLALLLEVSPERVHRTVAHHRRHRGELRRASQ